MSKSLQGKVRERAWRPHALANQGPGRLFQNLRAQGGASVLLTGDSAGMGRSLGDIKTHPPRRDMCETSDPASTFRNWLGETRLTPGIFQEQC